MSARDDYPDALHPILYEFGVEAMYDEIDRLRADVAKLLSMLAAAGGEWPCAPDVTGDRCGRCGRDTAGYAVFGQSDSVTYCKACARRVAREEVDSVEVEPGGGDRLVSQDDQRQIRVRQTPGGDVGGAAVEQIVGTAAGDEERGQGNGGFHTDSVPTSDEGNEAQP